ncbi:ASPIC/UnbV domain-containing protein [Stieleria sp.]|uniref:ASPIC/UnbV domain-containing protein n=1 Tax=Stieleria sp. TaxID=2795976 RepID=UPI00356241F1
MRWNSAKVTEGSNGMDSIGFLARCRWVTLSRLTDCIRLPHRVGLTHRGRVASWVCLSLLGLVLVSGCGSEPSPASSRSSSPTVSEDHVAASDPNSGDPNSGDPNSGDPNSGDPNSGDPNSGSNEVADGVADRKGIIERADAFKAQARYREAYELLKTLLIVDPEDTEILFRMAMLAAADGDLAAGVELLGEIPVDHPQAGLAAQGQSADWCLLLHRYDEAEQRYRRLLDRMPNAVTALRQLAFLYNRQGRRQEAAELVRRLCLLGNVMQDELHSLISLSDAMYSPPDDQRSATDQPQLPPGGPQYVPISPYGDARLAFQERRFDDVIELLRPAIERSQAPPAMVALFGRAAGELQSDSMLAWWLTQLPPQITEYADYWATLGMMELMERRYDSAIRVLGEALQRDPTDFASTSRMRQALGSLGKEDEAQRWFDHWTRLRASIDANNQVAMQRPPDPTSVESLANALDDLDRPLEAILWRAIVAHGAGDQQRLAELNEQRESLLADGKPFPDRQSRLQGTDLELYPLPDLKQWALDETNETPTAAAAIRNDSVPASFRNFADAMGMRHTYRVADQPQRQRYAIYQTLGGGVAVLDYDLDGWPDLFFAQGAADPPGFASRTGNPSGGTSLYRNETTRLVETSALGNALHQSYTLGVTAGDWNQDGLPDLAAAGIGRSVLLINNGDGTFAINPLEKPAGVHRVPASIAIADLSGDRLPDLIEIGYVDDPNMTVKPPVDSEGNVLITVAPNNFAAARDFLFTNQGDGSTGFRPLSDQDDSRTGLGLVIADFDGEPGNEIFIGNDSLPNRLWKLGHQNDPVDLASILGCGYGFSGGATGAMGIAVGDFDRNHEIDLHVTNYENENANLYLMKHRSFQDRNRQFNLGEASKERVGFGTQAIDYDNDGDEDLVVTNGHLDNAKSIRGGHAQPMQLFANVGSEFRLMDVADPSGFWSKPQFGRALATLDLNRDGQMDFVVTQVERSSALLVNQTDAGQHWMQVALVGTRCERDAIGARVELHTAGQTTVRWMVAGDGYLCRNEQTLHFGLGSNATVDRLRVQWPTGQVQTFENIPADRRVLIVEAEPELFTLP